MNENILINDLTEFGDCDEAEFNNGYLRGLPTRPPPSNFRFTGSVDFNLFFFSSMHVDDDDNLNEKKK